jgi:putative endonuclease
MYYVYIIKSLKNSTLYVGYTNNLRIRFDEHNHGNKPDSFTYRNRPWTLVYYEAYKSKSDAVLREKKLKQHGSAIRLLKERIHTSISSLE